MLDDGDEQLDGQSGGDHRQSRPRHRALLVQRPILGRLRGGKKERKGKRVQRRKKQNKTKKKHPKKTKQEGRVSHVAGRHDVVAKVAAEAGAGQGAAQRRRRRPFDAPAGRPRRPQAVAHHQVRVEAQRRVDGQLQSINIHQDHDCVTPHRGISSTAVLYRT